MLQKKHWTYLWNWLVGKRSDFTVENRAFNAISVITLALLIVILPINTALGLQAVELVLLVLIILQSLLYYQSRVKKRYKMSMSLYIIASYGTLLLNFFVNSGSQGPTIYLFLLTFQLIVAFAPYRQHFLWAIFHIVLVGALLCAEHLHPEWIPENYDSASGRIFDLITAYSVILLCMYFVTSYLRNNYKKEKRMAENRAATILEQNQMILEQNAALDRVNSEKDKLLSVIAYDLKTPLSKITSTMETLIENGEGHADNADIKKDALAVARNISDMLANMQSWTDTSIKHIAPVINPLEVALQTEKIYRIYRSLADRKNIRLDIEVPVQLMVKADEQLLQIVLRNLVSNAIKFTPNEGAVMISAASERNNMCLLTVRDTGIGMSKEQVMNLFDLNIQSSYGTRNEAGLSLGLTLVKEYINVLGGKVWVESIEGTGSTFFVLLPMA